MLPAIEANGTTMIPDPKRIEADAKHGQATGLLIPESTPGPNTSRFEADNARRQVESAKAASSEVKPGITSNEGSATVSGRKGKGREVPDTSPQTSAVQRVLDCGPTQYYQILGVKDPSTKEEFKKAYSKLYRTLHPDKNKKKGARDAFGRKPRILPSCPSASILTLIFNVVRSCLTSI